MWSSVLVECLLTWRPSMASFRMLGVSLEACLKEKLLQSMMRMNPLICSSGFSIRTSRDSRMARRMSVNEFLMEEKEEEITHNPTHCSLPQHHEASILCPDCCWDGGEVLKCSVGSVYINTINHH